MNYIVIKYKKNYLYRSLHFFCSEKDVSFMRNEIFLSLGIILYILIQKVFLFFDVFMFVYCFIDFLPLNNDDIVYYACAFFLVCSWDILSCYLYFKYVFNITGKYICLEYTHVIIYSISDLYPPLFLSIVSF